MQRLSLRHVRKSQGLRRTKKRPTGAVSVAIAVSKLVIVKVCLLLSHVVGMLPGDGGCGTATFFFVRAA
jgi:hypothetical protein